MHFTKYGTEELSREFKQSMELNGSQWLSRLTVRPGPRLINSVRGMMALMMRRISFMRSHLIAFRCLEKWPKTSASSHSKPKSSFSMTLTTWFSKNSSSKTNSEPSWDSTSSGHYLFSSFTKFFATRVATKHFWTSSKTTTKTTLTQSSKPQSWYRTVDF